MKFRKKPVIIEAFQLTKETRWNNESWPGWLHEAWNKDRTEPGAVFSWINESASVAEVAAVGNSAFNSLAIMTLEGLQRVSVGDWIIQGVKGELYPCKPDIFHMTYEPIA